MPECQVCHADAEELTGVIINISTARLDDRYRIVPHSHWSAHVCKRCSAIAGITFACVERTARMLAGEPRERPSLLDRVRASLAGLYAEVVRRG